MSRAATWIEWLALLGGDVTIFLSRGGEGRGSAAGNSARCATRISRSRGGGGARGHLRRARRNRKTLFGGSSTYGTRDQTYLEEKIRLEGAAVSAENVAEVETNEAAESLANRWIRTSFFQTRIKLGDTWTWFGYRLSKNCNGWLIDLPLSS